MASTRSSLAATTEFAFATRFVVQLTAGVLSEKSRQCCLFIGINCSRISICPMMAAISRSLLVSMPCLYLCTTSSGHWTRHTVGWNEEPNHTPPAPSEDASQVPAAFGVSWTSSLTWVARAPRDRMICRMSASASRRSLCFPMPTILGSPRRALYSGVMRPFAAGRMRVALEILPTTDRNRLLGTRLFFSIRWSSVQSLSAFSCGSWTVRFLPSSKKPRTIFCGRNVASPFWSFLIETESFPPSCFVISGGGKIECTPYRVALAMRRSRVRWASSTTASM